MSLRISSSKLKVESNVAPLCSEAPRTTMPYHTTGGWIQAFEQALNALLVARSGPHNSPAYRVQAHACPDHPDCIVIDCDSRRDHVPWREHLPSDSANSIARRYP